MTRTAYVTAAMLVAGAFALAGCGPASGPESPSPASSTAAAASTAPAHSASAPLPGDHASTSRYRIDINYPELPASAAALAQALHEASDAAKRSFMQALPDPQQFPEFADRQLLLKLDYSVEARMPAFISVRERGMSDTGGAHPLPIDHTFVYDVRAGRVIALDDLFMDAAAARGRLANFARKALVDKLMAQAPDESEASAGARREWLANMRQMINEGTAPDAGNFSEFVVLAGAGDAPSGLMLVFPPYQVAPYVYGTQTVNVPVQVFADALKPSYRAVFVPDGSD